MATEGHVVSRKRVQRLMRLLGLAAIYQRPNTSKPVVAHKIYPYLLGGLALLRSFGFGMVGTPSLLSHDDGASSLAVRPIVSQRGTDRRC